MASPPELFLDLFSKRNPTRLGNIHSCRNLKLVLNYLVRSKWPSTNTTNTTSEQSGTSNGTTQPSSNAPPPRLVPETVEEESVDAEISTAGAREMDAAAASSSSESQLATLSGGVITESTFVKMAASAKAGINFTFIQGGTHFQGGQTSATDASSGNAENESQSGNRNSNEELASNVKDLTMQMTLLRGEQKESTKQVELLRAEQKEAQKQTIQAATARKPPRPEPHSNTDDSLSNNNNDDSNPLETPASRRRYAYKPCNLFTDPIHKMLSFQAGDKLPEDKASSTHCTCLLYEVLEQAEEAYRLNPALGDKDPLDDYVEDYFKAVPDTDQRCNLQNLALEILESKYEFPAAILGCTNTDLLFRQCFEGAGMQNKVLVVGNAVAYLTYSDCDEDFDPDEMQIFHSQGAPALGMTVSFQIEATLTSEDEVHFAVAAPEDLDAHALLSSLVATLASVQDVQQCVFIGSHSDRRPVIPVRKAALVLLLQSCQQVRFDMLQLGMDAQEALTQSKATVEFTKCLLSENGKFLLTEKTRHVSAFQPPLNLLFDGSVLSIASLTKAVELGRLSSLSLKGSSVESEKELLSLKRLHDTCRSKNCEMFIDMDGLGLVLESGKECQMGAKQIRMVVEGIHAISFYYGLLPNVGHVETNGAAAELSNAGDVETNEDELPNAVNLAGLSNTGTAETSEDRISTATTNSDDIAEDSSLVNDTTGGLAGAGSGKVPDEVSMSGIQFDFLRCLKV